MNYYLITHDIYENDIYVNIEQQGSLQLLSEGKIPKITKTYYAGKNFTDYISLGGFGISDKAMYFLKSECNDNVSFISTVIYSRDNDEPLNIYLTKINQEVDCIDYEKSDLFMLNDKKIRRIKKLIFKDNIIEKIFRVNGLKNRIFVNENLKEKMIKIGLKGFEFIPIEKFTF